MTEKMIFEFSGLIKDKNDLQSIEFWGHDAGEFTVESQNKIKSDFAIQVAEWESLTEEEQKQYETELIEALEKDFNL